MRFRRHVLALVVVAALGSTSLSAAHAAGGDITGHITGSHGEALSTCVTAFDESFTWTTQACTDETGAYTLTDLTEGSSYRLQADGAGDYVGEWAQDAAGFDDATAYPTGSVVDITLNPGAHLEGTLSNADGSPAVEVQVLASPTAAGDPNETTTDEQGRWSMTVAAGTYVIMFGREVPQYAFGTTSYDAAYRFTVAADETVQIDDQLLPHGTVRGRVVDAVTGAPLADVCARLIDPAQPNNWELGTGCTDSQGRYSLTATTDGTFAVVFRDNSSAGYAPTYSGNVARLSQAQTVVVTGTSTVTVGARLKAGGTVTGRVVNATTGAGVAQMCPDLYFGRTSERLEISQDQCSSANGYFRITGVPAVPFSVSLRPGGPGVPYATIWAGGSATQTKAKTWSTTAGSTVRLGTTALPSPGVVSGVVKDMKGHPVEGAWVDLSGRTVGRMGHGDAPFETQTDATGAYTIYAPPGTYTPIVYQDNQGGREATLAPEWSGNASSREAAAPKTVRSGQTVTWSPWMAPGSFITGTVVTADGAPSPYALEGDAFMADGIPIASFYALPGGTFRAGPLPAGTMTLLGWTIDTSTGAMAPAVFDATTDQAAATPVVVGARQTVDILWHLP